MDLNSLRGMTVLVTGGLGFIGSATTRALLEAGANVRILDNLLPQVHGPNATVPKDIKDACDVQIADIRDRAAVQRALRGCQGLVHLAAETGTGQSMYAASHHFEVNTVGTAIVLEEAALVPELHHLVFASSRAVYGEGAYLCREHGLFTGTARQRADLEQGLYEVRCPHCHAFGTFLPTPENAMLAPQSVYGVTKHDLEMMVGMLVRRADQHAVVLRFQNVYGPGQSLINPYTGILAIFSALAKRQEEILIFEDGEETRDFVFIDDVSRSILTALCTDREGRCVYNVGTGVPVKVIEVAKRISQHFNSSVPLTISHFARVGDIRHNAADMTRARAELGFEARVPFEEGLARFLAWVDGQKLEGIAYRASMDELKRKGVIVTSTRGRAQTG